MKPYYDQNGITIYHGDCREILPSLECVDVVIADPPYGDTSLDWDVAVSGWLDLLQMKKSASLWHFGSFRFFMAQAEVFRKWSLAQDLVWEKHNGSGFHADRFKRVHEHVVQFYKGGWRCIYKNPVHTQDAMKRAVRRKRRPRHMGEIGESSFTSEDGGPRLMRSVIHVRSCHGDAVHPTQKPLGIIAPLIEYSVPANGVVLDPFMGSGSTLRASFEMGREAIGIEIEEKYCELAVKRLAQGVLF